MNEIASIFQHVLQSEAATAMTSGAVVLGLMGFLGYQLRALPGRIALIVEQQFTTTLVVQGDDMPFARLDQWLAKHPMTRKARRLAVVTWYDVKAERNRFDLTPGAGRHFLRENGRWFMVTRELKQAGQAQTGGGPEARSQVGGVFGRQESITITTYGRSHAPLKALLEKLDTEDKQKSDRVVIYGWHGGYGEIGTRAKRPLDTIYCDETLKAALVADLTAFMGRRAWCAERGIPWRRGFLLNGPPGTGKSSLIVALASLFDAPVFTINASAVYSDTALMEALNFPRPGGFFVMEDVDSIEVLKARPDLARIAAQQERAETQSEGPRLAHAGNYPAAATAYAGRGAQSSMAPAAPQPPRINVDVMGSSVTLSGFLNAIDGIAGAEGRILFMTTNCPDDLDPALTRAGRIDKSFHMGPARAAEAQAMFARFFPGADACAFARTIAPRLPCPQAELQNLMLALAEHGDRGPEAIRAALQDEITRRFAA